LIALFTLARGNRKSPWLALFKSMGETTRGYLSAQASAKAVYPAANSCRLAFKGDSYKMYGAVRTRLFIVALAILAANTGCKKKVVDPFPAPGAVAGWQKSTDTRVFAAGDLWPYIDGDAEQYIQAGVISASTSGYKYQDQLQAVIDVYTMKDSAGARKILEASQTSPTESVQLGDAGIAYGQIVIFRKGPYLVRIVAYDDMPGAQQALIALARGVDSRL
jgi:hypothetical protein